MTKFDSEIAEEAYALAGAGFALDTFGSVEEPWGWNALVDLDDALVWIKEDNYGFVDIVMRGTDNGARSGTDLVNREWDAFVEASLDTISVD